MDEKEKGLHPDAQQPVSTEVVSYIYCRYITKNGKRIYPKNGKCFRIPITPDSKDSKNSKDSK